MAKYRKPPPPSKRNPNIQLDDAQDFEDLGKAQKKGFLGRFTTRLDDALETSRGSEQQRNVVEETVDAPHATADDLAMRRAKTVSPKKMIIPEGVIIEGSLVGGSETEIGGRVDGNITVDGRLYLGKSALVSGNVSAGSCRVEGLVEGKVDCTDELELTKTGRLNADVMAGKKATVAGQVYGNVTTPGVVRLLSGCRVEGNVRARSLVLDEGAMLYGECSMRPPTQRSPEKTT
jgi:cytoskeletal protein CcmA (bactofilin family)